MRSARVTRLPTILDVAERSGVSKSTVSNVVRGVETVAPDIQRRVLDAIAELGYRPNGVARHLVRRRTNTVGVVIGDLANPFYSELAKLIEQQASARGYETMICNTDGRPESERARIESLLEHRVDGLLLLQFSGERSLLVELRAREVPVVLVSGWADGMESIAVDDREAAYAAVSHLVELGHQRIAYVSSSLVEHQTDAARQEGYAAALAAAGLEPEPPVRPDALGYRLGDPAFRGAVRRVARAAGRPTAFFASNDLLAVDLLEALEDAGLRVPADASVVGFDDIALAGLGRVALTTVSQPREELARGAVELLVRKVEGGDGLPLRQVRLRASLVVRGTTGPAPDGRG